MTTGKYSSAGEVAPTADDLHLASDMCRLNTGFVQYAVARLIAETRVRTAREIRDWLRTDGCSDYDGTRLEEDLRLQDDAECCVADAIDRRWCQP